MNFGLLGGSSRVFDGVDPMVVSEYVNQHVGPHRICLPRESSGAALRHRKLSQLDLCHISYGGGVRIISQSLNDIFHVQLMLQGSCLQRAKGQDVMLGPGMMLVINPDDPVDLSYSQDCEKFILKMPVALLEGICDEQRWSRPEGGLRFLNTIYSLDQLRGMPELLSIVCQEAESSISLRKIQEHYAHIVACKMLTTLSSNIVGPSTDTQDHAFQRVLRYIDENLKCEIRCSDLASVACMSERTLYAQFERRLGKAPKHYIQQKKMERIRHCLSDPACNVRGVTEIALDYGFSHLGRFSEQYKKRFAEAPSDTLRNRGLRAELVAPHRGATLPQTS